MLPNYSKFTQKVQVSRLCSAMDRPLKLSWRARQARDSSLRCQLVDNSNQLVGHTEIQTFFTFGKVVTGLFSWWGPQNRRSVTMELYAVVYPKSIMVTLWRWRHGGDIMKVTPCWGHHGGAIGNVTSRRWHHEGEPMEVTSWRWLYWSDITEIMSLNFLDVGLLFGYRSRSR